MPDAIQNMVISAYRIPTESLESDGTLEWDSTTLVLVEVEGCGNKGLGYTYGDACIGDFIDRRLKPRVIGKHPFDIGGIVADLSASVRNEGQPGLSRMAISAVDSALWDIKAKILGLPLCRLIGMVREQAMVYASGGFTSYTDERLAGQLGEWASEGFQYVKMKVGRQPESDVCRVGRAREAIGPNVSLFIDANGAYQKRTAMEQAYQFARYSVSWFEEPVSSDDLAGLREMRENAPAAMRVAAGEYAYTGDDFLRLLQTQAVDVLQADATRCGGITGLLEAGCLSEAFHTPFSFHCAPALHLHAALCIPAFFIGEFFYDHVRIERLLFDGAGSPVKGMLSPDLSSPGLGLTFKTQDAAAYRIK
ncbi:enolase C-terminal domain-like protein [Puia sp. P3]|uniref:enolase C-terminal domain-like protein n=1 Tax=Puia sp. P3 TaxID=3423952 RepID=UPI003D670CF0